MAVSLDQDAAKVLHTKQHIMFCYRSLKFLPTQYQSEDSNRMTLAYFCLSSLSLLPASAISSAPHDRDRSALDGLIKDELKREFADWVYARQACSGGFRGSDSLDGTEGEEGMGEKYNQTSMEDGAALPSMPGLIPLSPAEQLEYDQLMAFPSSPSSSSCSSSLFSTAPVSEYLQSNIIQSYTALLVLGLLSDDLTRVNRKGLIRFIARCQNDDGSISQYPGCPEPGDPRSTYSAFAISSILDDWTGLDIDRALSFLDRCRRPEGGYATRPGLEPQGGTTYCAIASYSLCSRLTSIVDCEATLRWLVSRQVLPPIATASADDDSDEDEDDRSGSIEGTRKLSSDRTKDGAAAPIDTSAGFQGRIGKATDACYSFWCTAAIKILRPRVTLIDEGADRAWLLSCQSLRYGGISRDRDAPPDIYHTYLSLAALSLHHQPGLIDLDPAWNVASVVAARMRRSLGHSLVDLTSR